MMEFPCEHNFTYCPIEGTDGQRQDPDMSNIRVCWQCGFKVIVNEITYRLKDEKPLCIDLGVERNRCVGKGLPWQESWWKKHGFFHAAYEKVKSK